MFGSTISTSAFIFITTFLSTYSNTQDTSSDAGVSDITKAMIFMVQTLGIITQIDINVPDKLRKVSIVLSAIYSPANALPCLLQTQDHFLAALYTTILRLVLPIMIFLLLCPLWLVYSRAIHRHLREMFITHSTNKRSAKSFRPFQRVITSVRGGRRGQSICENDGISRRRNLLRMLTTQRQSA